MSFDKHQAIGGEDQPAYSPTDIDISLSVKVDDKTRCPNCIIADVDVTPAEKNQRFLEGKYGGRWIRADNYEDEGYPFAPDVEVKLHTDGVFRGVVDEDLLLPAMRVFARDGFRGGMVEKSVPSAETDGWYQRLAEKIYGVGLAYASNKIRVRTVIGGENLTPKHLVDGGMAYDKYEVRCYVKVWETEPAWDAGSPRDISDNPDHVLPTTLMSLAGGAQPYFEAEFDPPDGAAGTLYLMPMFTVTFLDPVCELLAPFVLGPVPWYLEVDDGGLVEYSYVGKVDV